MALPPLVSVEEFERRLSVDVPDGDERAEAALVDASSLVREEARRDWVDENDESVAPAAIQRVVIAVAKRDYLNPDGVFRQESETAGPFTHSRSRGDDDLTVFLTEQESEIVRRYRPQGRPLWTQKRTRGEDGDETLWSEDEFGAELFPLYSTWDVVS